MISKQNHLKNKSGETDQSKRTLRQSFAERILPGLVLVALAATSPPALAGLSGDNAAPTQGTVEWQSDLEEALTEAAEQDKVVLLRFTAD